MRRAAPTEYGHTTGILDLEAYLGGEFLHPGGRELTESLLAWLRTGRCERVLEIGCGAGATAAWLASAPGTTVVALDRSEAMLQAAARRRAPRVQLVRADGEHPLPFRSSAFDVVYAESVIALLDVERVLPEMTRVLGPGGRLAINERIWRPGVSPSEVARINAASRGAFGIPAATKPFDREAWIGLLQRVGLAQVTCTPVDALLPPVRSVPSLGRRLARAWRYACRPGALYRSLVFKARTRQLAPLFTCLESLLFTGRKPGDDHGLPHQGRERRVRSAVAEPR